MLITDRKRRFYAIINNKQLCDYLCCIRGQNNCYRRPLLHAWLHPNLTYYQKTKFERRPKLKQSADDNFEFDVNSRKFSKLVENTVGKGEIARYEQFLLFPKCFQKACFPGVSKGVIVWEWVKYNS